MGGRVRGRGIVEVMTVLMLLLKIYEVNARVDCDLDSTDYNVYIILGGHHSISGTPGGFAWPFLFILQGRLKA